MDISRITFEQLKNTRDLGQFTAMDGRRIRPRHLLRSGNLHALSLEDRAILQNDYQIKTVIDFRTETEREHEPDTKISGVTYHWIPILDEATMGITHEESGKSGMEQLISLLMNEGFDAKQYMIATYRQLVNNSYSRGHYRRFFDILLTAPTDGAVLWHCSAGKDRVGIIATVSTILAKNDVNILNINQNIMEGFFNMVMIAEMPENAKMSLGELQKVLKAEGEKLGLDIKAQHMDIFNVTHNV